MTTSCPRKAPARKKEKGRGAESSVAGEKEADEEAAEAAKNAENERSVREAVDAPGRPYTKHVYSKDLRWVPQGDQAQRFPEGIEPMHEDVLLAKLRPGQMVELEAHARIGIGEDHAKYSPVATACYRMMPRIELLEEVYDDLAEELDLCEPGVFDLVPCGGGRKKAVVRNPYACTMSRNFMRNERLKKAVKITQIPNHFIFSVESVGMLPSAVILAQSLKILKMKCNNLIRLADETLESEDL